VPTDNSNKPRGNVAPTVDDLVPVGAPRTDSTQLMDPLGASSPELIKTDPERQRVATTDQGLPPVPPTSTDLPPVEGPTGSLPQVPSASALPAADATASSLPPVEVETATTAPRLGRAPAATREPTPRFELTPTRVALAGLGVSLLGVMIWLLWPALTRPPKPQPVEWVDGPPVPAVAAPVKPSVAPPSKVPTAATPAPSANELRLDTKTDIIDPRALHAPDLSLEPTHKYRLSLKVDDPKAGVVLARLEEKAGWGVLHVMATHHALQFGGVRTLRLHCEPGTDVKADTTMVLELEDLARKSQRKTLSLSPAKDCYDFETARLLDLEPGQSRRVQLRSEQTAVLGEQTKLRVAYRIPISTEPPAWRFGVLEPGDDVLVQGPGARFAVIDPWVGDNQGSVVLQLLPGDTDRRGLVKPESDATKFVPNRP
jgi:hypothetical protein